MKMLENTNFLTFQGQKLLKYQNFWGVDPRGFQKCGFLTPATLPSQRRPCHLVHDAAGRG